MHLYLNYAREHSMKEGENPPIGLILCAEKEIAEAERSDGESEFPALSRIGSGKKTT